MDMLKMFFVSTSSDDIRESATLAWLKHPLRIMPELHSNHFPVPPAVPPRPPLHTPRISPPV